MQEDGGTAEGTGVPLEQGRQTEERTRPTSCGTRMPASWAGAVGPSPGAEQDEQVHCRAARQECRRCEYERADQERLAAQAQKTAETQASLGLHMPVQDEHGEDLDYIHNVEQEE